jgi:predicted MPP superfamily phosphohydrolase
MFFPIVLGLYILLNIYTLLRIRGLFASRWRKNIFTLLYVIVATAFPVTEILSHASAAAGIGPLLKLGYLTLPFLLYLFLLVFLRDVLLGLNRLLNLVSVETLRNPRLRTILLWCLFAVPALTVFAGRVHFSDLRINRYSIAIPARSSSLRHLRIALASDFHLKELTDEDFMPRFVALVNSADADVVLIPGDVLEGDRQDGQLEEFESQFRSVRTKWGMYASPGNHESFGRRTRLDFFRKSGITILQDSVLVVANAFTLVGRNDNHVAARKSIADLMASASDSLPVIVMDHRPTDIHSVRASNADILVSGHSHHGQLFPFNFITEKVYELSWGYRKVDNTHLFVTSGAQVWGPPVRTAGDSEIMIIDVDFAPVR